jgi:predicted AAA+ superfamily ATPase
MIPRLLSPYAIRDAGYYPIVIVTGPRQSGKTTLAKAAFPNHEYLSFEDTETRSFAKDDPKGFLTRHSGPVIFDEAQRVPDLFSALQTSVDKDASPGRFVLTGSQNFLLLKDVSQSLAGRSGILHLLPFSRAELDRRPQSEPGDPLCLFTNRISGPDLPDLWEAIRTGFYPRIHDRGIPPEVWLADYVLTYIERDVRSLVNIGDLDGFERFLGLVAGRVGQLLNYSSLASDAGVSVDTARRWISVLKTSFIVFSLAPHHRNFNKRLIKSPKLYFYDTGLACYLLGLRSRVQLETHPLRGALFENFVIAEVAKAYFHHRRQPPLFFWRDRIGHEVDLLIEEGGALYPMEMKSGATVGGDMLDALLWWRRLSGRSEGKGEGGEEKGGESTGVRPILVYGGDDAYERRGVAVRPWFSI